MVDIGVLHSYTDTSVEFGLSREELLKAFSLAVESSTRDFKLLQERSLLTLLGEFPSEEKALSESMKKLESLDNEEIILVFILALLKVIKANNERMAKQLEFYLKNSSIRK